MCVLDDWGCKITRESVEAPALDRPGIKGHGGPRLGEKQGGWPEGEGKTWWATWAAAASLNWCL